MQFYAFHFNTGAFKTAKNSGWQHSLSASWINLPSSKSRLEISPAFTEFISDNKALSFSQPSISVAYR